MAKTTRVVFRWNGGFVSRQASEEESEQAHQVLVKIIEKWKADPGIRFICYYLCPGTSHHAIFELDDIAKVDEMDHDMWSTKGTLLESYSFEVVFGSTGADEFFAS